MNTLPRLLPFLVLLALALRLAHAFAAGSGPLGVQLGPDEDFYLRFGRHVADGGLGMSTEFAFMDPLYGYLLGVLAWLFPSSTVAAAHALQALVDTLTMVGVFLLGRRLGNERAGLAAALLYGLCATAVMYSATLLKATWVAAFLVAWSLLALRAIERPGKGAWLWLGLLCGAGVALRSNMLLVLMASLALPLALEALTGRAWRRGALASVLVAAGALAWLLPMGARNAELTGSWSPLPTNGGVVLHQVYNPGNPDARPGVPDFVPSYHPSEIWRAHAAEAVRRTGRELAPADVDRFWGAQARAHLAAEPARAMRNVARKALEFTAWREVPNNRNLLDERRFSAVLRWLPHPWLPLWSLGAIGLLLLVREDRRGLVLLVPLATIAATFVVFFPESRFRFGAVPILALGAGWAIDRLLVASQSKQWRAVAWPLAAATLLGVISVVATRTLPPVPPNWERIANGYLAMGRLDEAGQWAAVGQAQSPDHPGVQDLLGVVAMERGDPAEAAARFRAALAIDPHRHVTHYNLSLTLERLGELDAAYAHALEAVSREESPVYAYRVAHLLEALGHPDEARAIWAQLARGGSGAPEIAHASRQRLLRSGQRQSPPQP